MKTKRPIFIFLFVFLSIFSLVGFVKASVLGFDTSTPCTYWEDVFNFGMSAAGILTLVMLVLGGLYYIVSLGQEEKLGNAKKMMTGAMAGFLLALFSYLIFQVISPSLLQCRLDIPDVILPEPTGDFGPEGDLGGGPNGLSDPCAGVADEDLKATSELCESEGGREGGACDGRCLQVPEIPVENTNDENDESNEDADENADVDESVSTDVSADEGSSTLLSNVERAGKWCCAGGGSCNDVARYLEDGRITANPGPRRDLEDGIGTRTCSWMSSSNTCSNANPCEGYSREVPIDQRICSLLVAIVEQGGLRPHVSNVVIGHGRCRRCQNEGASYPCNRDSSHWHGTAMDLRTDDDIQRWIAENVAVDSLYGPLGLPQSERSQRQSVNCSSQRFQSEFFINMGRGNASISGGTACTHRQHIHVDYDFN